MSEPERLYVLTRGAYSDTEIVAGALDEATLLLFVAGLGTAAPDYDIHPVPRLAPGTEAHVYTTWTAYWNSYPPLRKNGIQTYASVRVAQLDADAQPPPEPPHVERHGSGDNLAIYVAGVSEAVVRQACAAEVAQWEADAGKAQP